MVLIPLLYDFIPCFSNVPAVADRARKGARHIQPLDEGSVGAVLDIKAAIQTDVRSPGAESFDLDRTPGAGDLDDLIPQLLDSIIQSGFYQPGGARDQADQLRLLNGIPLLDAGTRKAEDFNSMSHDGCSPWYVCFFLQ